MPDILAYLVIYFVIFFVKFSSTRDQKNIELFEHRCSNSSRVQAYIAV